VQVRVFSFGKGTDSSNPLIFSLFVIYYSCALVYRSTPLVHVALNQDDHVYITTVVVYFFDTGK
jgi:hypothetical protein